MNDDEPTAPMDELLIHAARDYNEPADVPRDEMWAVIAAARTARTTNTSHGSRSRRVWVIPSAGIAAAALIAVGITIGRSTRPSKPVTVAVTPVAATPKAIVPTAATPRVDTTSASEPDTIVKSLRDETRRTDADVRRVAKSTTRADSRQLAYRLVVLRHLAGSEALITTFRTTSKRGQVDAQVGAWARDLLGTTRLLESSPAADDPVMKRLLEDLDLVIAQIAQYTARGTYDPNELDLIEQSIRQRGVITKLRGTTAPSAARM